MAISRSCGLANAATFRLEHKRLLIAPKRHPIGPDETGDVFWSVKRGSVGLANVDERDVNIRDGLVSNRTYRVPAIIPVDSVTFLPGC